MPKRVALVTGAGKGIGRAVSLRLAASNHDLVLVSRSQKNLVDTASDSRQLGARVDIHVCDLVDVDARREFLLSLQMGIGMPSVVVNNLGGSLATGPLASVEDWQRVWQFNVGVAHVINLSCLPFMKDQGWGRIVHVSTLSASTYAGYPAYVSAKCALEGYVKSMARVVFDDGIVLSAVAPGAISVEGKYLNEIEQREPDALAKWLAIETYTSRLGQPGEVAGVIDFLCSDDASYMAGAIVPVDGGG